MPRWYDPPALDPTGQQISHYKVVRKLGEGGMGEVYEATDQRLGRRVAIKLLLTERLTTDRQVRFMREAKTTGALNHPGIITMHDVGLWEGRLFIVMEYVDGEPLGHLAARGCPPEAAFTLVAEAADALAAAHAQGILHRDIKSDNLMLTRDGRIKVLDFGLAKLMSDAPPSSDELAPAAPPIDVTTLARTLVNRPRMRPVDLAAGDATPGQIPSPGALTRAGTVLGTPGFMSPEQTMGERVDAQSEVFSLGVVLYELLTRRRPFDRPRWRRRSPPHAKSARRPRPGRHPTAVSRRPWTRSSSVRSRSTARSATRTWRASPGPRARSPGPPSQPRPGVAARDFTWPAASWPPPCWAWSSWWRAATRPRRPRRARPSPRCARRAA